MRALDTMSIMRSDAPLPIEEIPHGHYAFPGPLRDALVSAILNGSKTSTTCLLAECNPSEDPRDTKGSLEAVLDSHGTIVCVTRITDVTVMRLGDVTDAHAIAEGEGYRNVAEWRLGHETFWRSPDYISAVGNVDLNDDTPVVCFSLIVDHRYPTRELVPWDAKPDL
ncbi:MAG: ASCH domain-containing protein [Actinomycetaceae bacterium]|nr:ASCH domain-containing protein [Actinomycetaceae bacterium]